jgi:hypothetical protein
MTNVRRFLVPLAICGLLVAGCGGDDDNDSGGGDGGERLSAADYRKQATEICQESERRTNELEAPEAPEDIKPFLERGLEITEEDIGRFSDLQPPEDLQEQHDAAVEASEEFISQIRDVTSNLEGNASDQQAIQEANAEIEKASEASDKAFDELGLEECAN